MRKTYKMDGYIFVAPAVRKNKKYSAYDEKTGKYLASFGDIRYEHYNDRIGHYYSKNHGDLKRKRLYYARHGMTVKKNTAKWFANNYLW